MSSPKKSSGFEQARDAWRDHWQRKDSGLTPAQRVLIGRIHADFNRKHFEETGELLAWRGWESITSTTGLSKATIFRGFRKFKLRGALEISHGGRNPKTGWKLGNTYKAIMPPGFILKPGQVSNRDQARFQNETRLSDRLSEFYNLYLLMRVPNWQMITAIDSMGFYSIRADYFSRLMAIPPLVMALVIPGNGSLLKSPYSKFLYYQAITFHESCQLLCH
jgi:hypothetical protein